MKKPGNPRNKVIESIASNLNEIRGKGECLPGEGKSSQKPSAAALKITPEGVESQELYVFKKMSALIGASARYRSEKKERKIQRHQDTVLDVPRRIESGDEKAIFDFIRINPENIGHPFVVRTIVKWNELAAQGSYRARSYIEKLPGALIPDRRGKKNHDLKCSSEEMLKYRFEREWVWYHSLEVFDSLTDRKIETKRTKTANSPAPGPPLLFKDYGLTPDHIESVMESVGIGFGHKPRSKLQNKYRAFAIEETATKFNLSAQSVKRIMTEYIF